MKVSSVLCRQHLGWYFRLGRNKLRFKNVTPAVPEALKKKGTVIHDPLAEYLNAKSKNASNNWRPPVENCPIFLSKYPRFKQPVDIREHPDFHEQSVYRYQHDLNLVKALDQAQILTKTVIGHQAPKSVKYMDSHCFLPDQDEKVQRIILQANRWDPAVEKLPDRIDPAKSYFRLKREWGIPPEDRIRMLSSNLLRLCSLAGSYHPKLFQDRIQSKYPYLNVHLNISNGKRLLVQGTHEWLISGNNPLPPFVKEADIDATVLEELPDISPLEPTIDIGKTQIYRSENTDGFNDHPTRKHFYPHIFVLSNDDSLSHSARHARAIMFLAGRCIMAAWHKFGASIPRLPTPISAQCFHFTPDTVYITYYQLNTLNIDNQRGVKNIAWLYQQRLFRCFEDNIYSVRTSSSRFADYNPKVFQRLFGSFLYGMDVPSFGAKTTGSIDISELPPNVKRPVDVD